MSSQHGSGQPYACAQELVSAQRRGRAGGQPQGHIPYRDSKLTFLLQVRGALGACGCEGGGLWVWVWVHVSACVCAGQWVGALEMLSAGGLAGKHAVGAVVQCAGRGGGSHHPRLRKRSA